MVHEKEFEAVCKRIERNRQEEKLRKKRMRAIGAAMPDSCFDKRMLYKTPESILKHEGILNTKDTIV